eukprot:1056872-Alexandrium_andersonii.AAC.1
MQKVGQTAEALVGQLGQFPASPSVRPAGLAMGLPEGLAEPIGRQTSGSRLRVLGGRQGGP